MFERKVVNQRDVALVVPSSRFSPSEFFFLLLSNSLSDMTTFVTKISEGLWAMVIRALIGGESIKFG